MKKVASIVMILFILPLYMLSQDKHIVWEYLTPGTSHIIDSKKVERIVFYDDNSFENLTFDPGHIEGRGTYDIDNSIITCFYDGEIDGDKGFVEIINRDKVTDAFQITVSNLMGEGLAGANILLKSSGNELVDKSVTDFDGVALIPKNNFNQIRVEFIGYKSLEAYVMEDTSTNLKFVLGD